MAYPMNYPLYYPQYQQSQNNPATIQTNGFISVRSEAEARNYPVAYGNSVTFKDENAPYVYTKTMGFSQLETPRFEKYKLVKEEPETAQKESFAISEDNSHSFVEKSEITAIWSEIEAIKKVLNKKEVSDDE